MFKFFERRRQRASTRSLLYSTGLQVKEKHGHHTWAGDSEIVCDLCDECERVLYQTSVEISPQGEKLIISKKIGSCCLRCGLVAGEDEQRVYPTGGYYYAPAKRIPIDEFINSYMDKKLEELQPLLEENKHEHSQNY